MAKPNKRGLPHAVAIQFGDQRRNFKPVDSDKETPQRGGPLRYTYTQTLMRFLLFSLSLLYTFFFLFLFSFLSFMTNDTVSLIVYNSSEASSVNFAFVPAVFIATKHLYLFLQKKENISQPFFSFRLSSTACTEFSGNAGHEKCRIFVQTFVSTSMYLTYIFFPNVDFSVSLSLQ